MTSHGGQDGPGDKQISSHWNKMKKTTRRLSSNALPSYLQPARLQSTTQPARFQSTTQETSSSSTQEPSIRHASLHGPITLPAGPSRSQSSALPTSTSGSSEVPGCSAAEGSVAAGGSTPCYTSSPRRLRSRRNVTSDVPAEGSTPSTTAPRCLRPRRNVTSDAPRDANDKFIVVLSPDYKIIDNHLATVITTIFEEYPQAVAYTYKMLPDAILQKYWEEFQKRCVWDRNTYTDDIMKKAFLDKLKNRYKGILNRVRKAGKRPLWCPIDVWEAWLRKWNSPEFKRRSALAKKARVGKDGVAKGTHTGGSSAHAKTAKKLEKEMGKAITPDHLFLFTHTHDHDGITFVNDRCKEIHARYENLTQGDQATEADGEAIDEVRAFYKASGGVTKDGRIFGLGSAASQYYRDSDRYPRNARAASASGGPSTSVGDIENNEGIRTTLQNILERLDGFSADKTSFIEHLQRLEERQQRVERSLSEGIPLPADVNEVRVLRERLINLETKIGSSLSQFQTSINQLKANVEGIESASHSDSSMSDSSTSDSSMS